MLCQCRFCGGYVIIHIVPYETHHWRQHVLFWLGDAIEEAEHILDILSATKNASTALAEFKHKHAAKLPKFVLWILS